MRPKPSHAAKSGVGEHTARESESAQCVRLGRERGELPPPSLALEPFWFRGLLVFRGCAQPLPYALQPSCRLLERGGVQSPGGRVASGTRVSIHQRFSRSVERVVPNALASCPGYSTAWGQAVPPTAKSSTRRASSRHANRFCFGLAFSEAAPQVFRFRREQDPSVI
jgi:hypothetical protein